MAVLEFSTDTARRSGWSFRWRMIRCTWEVKIRRDGSQLLFAHERQAGIAWPYGFELDWDLWFLGYFD